MVTLKDIESASGISKSTISRVINNDPNVKQETREKVWEYIKKMNYKPNIVARSMVKGTLPLVLVIVGDIQNNYFARTVTGIEKVLSDEGYMPVVYNSMYDVEKEKRLISMARDFKFAGIIPMTGANSAELEESLMNISCPAVLINKDIRKIQLDEVLGDDFGSGYMAAKHLIDNGHKCIAHMSGNSESSAVSKKRESGYCAALEDNGIKVDKNLIFRGNLDIKSGYEIAKKIFENPNITGICSNNFLMGMGLIRYGRTVGKHILRDYDLSCCECVPEMYENERIAYAGPDLEEIGKKAAGFLIKRIKNSKEPQQKIYFAATKVYNPKNKSNK
ncbi:MAG: LacI family transcriptional regulator [Clostridia bacterium]|jgi:LacI family transcriptional regulator|nr:LacI family transcriptional regulator [Clostridia bacterium]MCI2015930.1 LacI family transcriptional regulator [Clostridia bacterium]